MNEPKWTTHRVTMPDDMALEYLDKLLVVVNKQFLDPGFPIALSMAIDKMRAPLPDNKALTAEELREMDGQPVYIVCDPDANGEQLVMWALVEVDADGGEVYLTNNLGGRTEFLHSEDFDGMNIYRRPPEKGEP